MLNSLRVLGLLVIVAFGGGCGDGPAAPAASAPAEDPPSVADDPSVPEVGVDSAGGGGGGGDPGAPGGTIVSNGGTYFVEYTLLPDPIPLNEVFGIRVTVYRASDRTKPLRDVELAVDGRMPDHRHGMNREPRVVPRGDGGFDVSGMLFHMPGFWELHFDITQDGMTERAEMDVDLE